MTDATVEQQGESKRRREHPEVPQAADSSGSSSESSTDTMGLVDVCTILCDNSVSKRDGVAVKPVPVAEEMTLQSTEHSKPLLLMGSPIDSCGKDEEQTWAVLHLAFIGDLSEIQAREEVGPANSGGFRKQVPRCVPNSD